MSSTYSTNLGIELMATGENSDTWGAVTNTNLGTLLEQAISGYVTQAVSTGFDTTITIPDGSSGVARNMYIELTGTGGAATNLIVPAKKKLYFIYNNTASGQVTVKVSGQSGVSVANGDKVILACNGTDIVTATAYKEGTVTSVAGTGTVNGITLTGTVTSSGNLTLGGALSGVNLASQVTGTLPYNNGGTGQTSYADGQLLIGNTSTGGLNKATLTAGSNVTITNGNGTIEIAAASAGGTVTSVGVSGGTTGLTTSNSPITGSGTITIGGTLGLANGGTGQTTQQAALNALAGATTSAYYLRGNGTNVSMSALSASDLSGTVAVANGGTGQTSYTDGQLLIGNTTGNTLTKSTLTAGSGITITNGAGSITIAASGSTGNISIAGNTISSTNTNGNIILSPNGSGEVLVNASSSYFGAASTPLEVVGDSAGRVYPAIFVIRSEPRSVIVWNNTTIGDAGLMSFYTDTSPTFRGNIAYNRSSGLVAYNTSSDYRAKDVYGPVTDSGAKVDAIKIYRGKMHGATVERPMAIAHELDEVAPYAVIGTKDAVDEKGNPIFQQVDYTTLVPLLVAEIQSLRARVAALEAK